MVYSPLTEVKIGTQGRNLKIVSEAETHEGWPLTGLLSLLSVQIRTTYSEVALPTIPTSLPFKKMCYLWWRTLFNPGTLGGGGRPDLEFKASLVCIVNSRTASATQRDIISKNSPLQWRKCLHTLAFRQSDGNIFLVEILLFLPMVSKTTTIVWSQIWSKQ